MRRSLFFRSLGFRRVLVVCCAFLLAGAGAALPTAAEAQGRGIQVVRDAEIENTIRAYAAPLFAAAGLDSNAISVHLVNDSVLNAFVAGGQRIFLNTGLLIRAERPAQIIGVMAHEIGHIAGGHLLRSGQEVQNATTAMILSALFGAAAAVAGSGDAAAAAVLGGQQIAERSLLAYTRTQEASADQAGATFLEDSHQSVSGLIEFLKIIGKDVQLNFGKLDPYLQTHPLTPERVAALQGRLQRSPYKDAPDTPENIERFKRMQAKLIGYLNGLPATLQKYPETDTSLYGRYARAFAYFQALDFNRALKETDSLIAEYPNDPYFRELKADILFNTGKVADSVQPISEAYRLAPNEPLIAYGYAERLVALEDNSRLPEAIAVLKKVTLAEPDNIGAWQRLAVAYGRSGDIGMASLASAERFLAEGSLRDAQGQADRASRLLKQGSPGWLRAQDIVAFAKDQRREQRGGSGCTDCR